MGLPRIKVHASHERHRATHRALPWAGRGESTRVGSCEDAVDTRQGPSPQYDGRRLARNPIGGAAMRMSGVIDAGTPQAPPRVNAVTPREVYLWQ